MEQTTSSSSYQSSMFSGILRQIAASAASDNQQQQQQRSRISQVSQQVVVKRCDYDRKVDNLETKIRWIKEIKKWTMDGGDDEQQQQQQHVATEAMPTSGERKRSRKRGDVAT